MFAVRYVLISNKMFLINMLLATAGLCDVLYVGVRLHPMPCLKVTQRYTYDTAETTKGDIVCHCNVSAVRCPHVKLTDVKVKWNMNSPH